MQTRDYSLDAIKGVACILMILAHAKLNSEESTVVQFLDFMGGFAPILFFAASGVTSTFQSKKTSVAAVIIFYVMFAFLGLSWNGLLDPYFWREIIPWNILQIIAVGIIVVTLLEKYLKPQRNLYILFSISAFLIDYIINKNLKYAPAGLSDVLVATARYSMLPWLSMFFAGILAYYMKNNINLIIGGVQLSSLIIIRFLLNNWDINWKSSMSISYFLLSQSLIFFVFYICRRQPQLFSPKNILVYFGQHSLLFFYVHFIISLKFDGINFRQAYAVWISTFVLSYIFMKLSQYANKYIEKFFNNGAIWIVMIVFICITPVILNQPKYVVLIEMALGVLFANNYQSLAKLVKKRFSNMIAA